MAMPRGTTGIFLAMPGITPANLLSSTTGPLVIAHRGASASAPENTMPAFEAAWAAGCAWVEADVQPTSDNVPILFHDGDLDRTTDGTGPMRERTAYEIAELDAGSWFTTGSTRAFTGTPVPTLADLADTLGPTRSLLLEIKGAHTRDQVLAEISVVRASGWDDRVFFQSFEVQALAHVRSIDPDRPVGLLVEALDEDPVQACAAVGAIAYNPMHTLLRARPDIVPTLHAAGIAVLVWTADDNADWRFLTDIGVDGIITNRPAELLNWQQVHPS
jgi:glycerophosphoryl diester phosphodiesterase